LTREPGWRGARIGAALLTTSLTFGLFSAPSVAAPSGPAPSTTSQVASTPAENFVDWVYESLLFREPDPGGRAYWAAMVDAGRKGDFVHFVSASDEWQDVWIDVAYHRWLGRPADEGGLDFWNHLMDAGWSYADVEAYLGGSQEAFWIGVNHPGPGPTFNYVLYVFDVGIEYALPEDEVPEWAMLLGSSPELDLLYAVLFSDPGIESRVNLAFARTLDRAPDPGGLQFWGQLYADTGSMSLIMAHPLLSDEAWAIAQRPDDPLADRRSTANP
jgi:hypothetical protein